MQTGDRAGLGVQPNATPRLLLSRVMWAGGLAVAGSVIGAATASAVEVDQATELAGNLLGPLTATVEPLTTAVEPVGDLGGSVVGGADLVLSEDLRDDSLLGDAQLTDLVERSLTDLGFAAERAASSADRDAAAMRVDRSHDRTQDRAELNAVAADRSPAAVSTSDESPALDMRRLFGSVDSLLVTAEGINPAVTPSAGEPISGLTHTITGFGTLKTADPFSAVAGIKPLLDLPVAGGLRMLDPLMPLLEPLDSVMHTAVPVRTSTGLVDTAWLETSHSAPVTPIKLLHTVAAAAEAMPMASPESGAAQSSGSPDNETVVANSSLDVSPGGHPDDSRESLRPSLLMTPVAGLTALQAGAPGAALSADQAGPSSHALLPGEAVLRARLFSAAAYARNIEVKPLREANEPPVSPD